ncbi:hypothetical protein LCGC14_0730840 [marine sediment metagenome]|uniref:Uncharacterized protein n=1 Tax=marine sediment metagenome TaxID=412755 RepID=A0A0F9Q9Q1_9ZZZZ
MFEVLFGTSDEVVSETETLQEAKAFVVYSVHERGFGAEQFVVVEADSSRVWTLDPFENEWEEGI